LTALVGLSAAGIDNAQARYGRHGAFVAGAAVGAIGGAIIGSQTYRPYGYAYDDSDVYYRRPYYATARCHIERRATIDDYSGDTVIQRVRVCSRPGY